MKTCQAKNCVYPVFGKGYCKSHQYMRADFDRRSPLQKHLDKQKEQPTKYVQSVIDRREKELLQQWFEFHMEHSEMKCENCGEDLSGLNEKEWHGCQHHILEKSLFPSVKSELINHAVLGYYCCHGQWHSSYEKASKMPIWNTLVERVQPILHLVKEKHKVLELFKINEQLLK